MKENRSITAKTNLTVDDFLIIADNAKAARKSLSSHIRDCCLSCVNGKPAARPAARTSLGPFRAKFAPSRNMRPMVHMRS